MRTLGLIGGTGLYRWEDAVSSHEAKSRYGRPSAAVTEFRTDRLRVLFLPRHGPDHTIPPHAVNYRANIDVLRQLGVQAIIAVNAVGGISDSAQPGRLVVPDQLIDYTWGRAHTYSMGDSDELQHIEFAEPFDSRLRRGLLTASARAGLDVIDGGCVAVTQGPRLETAAEIRRFKNDGCDLVGMTSMPEAALAREVQLGYAAICVTANRAAGLESEPVTMQAIEATLAAAMADVRLLLTTYLREVSNVD